jgi:hypothetical protein
MRLNLIALLLFTSLTTSLLAQDAPPSPQFTATNLVMLDGDGRLVVPSSPTWIPTAYRLEDTHSRTTFVFENHRNDITLETSVFPGDDNTADACRTFTITPLLAQLRTRATVTGLQNSLRKTPSGTLLAVASFMLSNSGVNPGSQQNVYAFAAGPHICAELHITKSGYTPAFAPLIEAELDRIHFDPTYQPTSQDFNTIGGLFFDTKRDFQSAALYYRRALDTLPTDLATRTARRSLTDQLSMSYALYGDYIESYHVNEAAITIDPTYPFYYYNLACVDAELHNPQDARTHLAAAFDRRFNVLAGEQLPNPSEDSSIRKLSYDRKFWAYVKSISGIIE